MKQIEKMCFSLKNLAKKKGADLGVSSTDLSVPPPLVRLQVAEQSMPPGEISGEVCRIEDSPFRILKVLIFFLTVFVLSQRS